ncbi:sperm motility kinase 2B-like [Phodopus roborovskii]|uniref:sperm motility kinase 2B-like n=1 Tax=Phodopus roborovskii TaxID=109678 RepID=UPI0021E36695|nr:sperm motility kinase 2B-like [Phodopus roborovskii]XP_051062095.1 sperm motility kinase 2B-like [Phodopus roborovskii]
MPPTKKSNQTKEERVGLNPVPIFFGEEIFTSQYTVLRKLGQGANAKVMLAQHRLTGVRVAVKVLSRDRQWRQPSVAEVDILMAINHPNIVSLLQVIETEKNIYLIMEMAEGEQLFHYVCESGGLQENEARELFHQIVGAVGYCHDQGIVHRDLKPDNIIVDPSGKVKIIDFGLGTKVRPGKQLDRPGGAFHFGAPEFFLGVPYDGPKVDVWTLGVLLFFMVTGTLPFAAPSFSQLWEKVVQGRFEVPNQLSTELQGLIRHLLTVNPSQRPTVKEIKRHSWLRRERTSTHSEETIPSFPDPAIMAAMANIGFNIQDIREALLNRKFDETMASYCLLHHQARQGQDGSVLHKLRDTSVTHFTSPTDPVSFPLPLRRRATEPALQTILSSTGNQRLEIVRQPRQSAIEWDSPLCFYSWHILGTAHQCGARAPHIYPPSSRQGNTGNIALFEEKPLPGKPDLSKCAASSPRQHSEWKTWPRRLGQRLSKLCCCLPSQNEPLAWQNRVSPQK